MSLIFRKACVKHQIYKVVMLKYRFEAIIAAVLNPPPRESIAAFPLYSRRTLYRSRRKTRPTNIPR